MPEKIINWFKSSRYWSIIAGFSGVCFSNAVKSAVEEFAKKHNTSAFLLYVILFCISVLAFELMSALFHWARRPYRRIFTADEKGSDDYQKLVGEQIKNSDSMAFLLLSAYTMFYDGREIFIIKALRELSPEERKQKHIRVLMLHPNSSNFQRRAAFFVDQMNKTLDSARVGTVEEYTKRCIENAEQLIHLGAKVRYYSIDPTWRLQIFDKGVFFSFYSKQKSGHMTSSYYFPKEDANSAYYGFTKYFEWIWAGSVENLAEWPRMVKCPNCSESFPYALPPLAG